MNFSIVFNSRGRSNILEGCVNSFLEKAFDKNSFNFLVKVDEDDAESINKCQEIKNKYPFFSFLISSRPHSLNESVSKLAFQSIGDIIYGINDDIYMLTGNWDKIILDKIEKFKKEKSISDNIFYIYTECNSIDRNKAARYAGCPVISREAINYFDLYLPFNFVGLNADARIFELYDKIGRVVDCSGVMVDHLYHNTIFKVMSPDKTSSDMRANTYKNSHLEKEFDLEKYVNKFKEQYG